MFVIAALDAQRPQISESSPRHDIDWSVRGLPSMQLFQRIVFQISFFQEHFFTNHHHLLKLTFAKVQSVPPPCPGLPLIDSHISPLSHIPVITYPRYHISPLSCTYFGGKVGVYGPRPNVRSLKSHCPRPNVRSASASPA